MAVVVIWIHHWAIIALSLSALFTVIMFIIFCVCWDYNRKRFKNFYMFNKTISSGMNIKHPKLNVFTTPHVINEEEKNAPETPESYKVDTRTFDQVQLVIEDIDVDAVSCVSSESMKSFLSIRQQV